MNPIDKNTRGGDPIPLHLVIPRLPDLPQGASVVCFLGGSQRSENGDRVQVLGDFCCSVCHYETQLSADPTRVVAVVSYQGLQWCIRVGSLEEQNQ